MEQALVLLAAVALAGWVVAPMKLRRPQTLPAADGRLSDLVDAKQSVYRSLIDLELDYQQGKMAPADYERLRREGKKEALALLREIEGKRSSSADEVTLEEEIRAARARLHRE